MSHVLTDDCPIPAGGMLLVKLDVEDLQFEKMNPFEGTMAYAQNKRQQVIMTERWAEKFKTTGIHFSSMHPGTRMNDLQYDVPYLMVMMICPILDDEIILESFIHHCYKQIISQQLTTSASPDYCIKMLYCMLLHEMVEFSYSSGFLKIQVYSSYCSYSHCDEISF